jgi:hypothetical protein
MARTKITNRRSDVSSFVETPHTKWEDQKPKKETSNGLRLPIPSMLWEVLQEQGFEVPPRYFGTRHPLGEKGYTWRVTVVIYRKRLSAKGHEVNLRAHSAISPWTKFDDGIEDAARQALQVATANYSRRDREISAYRNLPQRRSGQLQVTVEEVEDGADPRVHTLTRALKHAYRRLDRAGDQICYLNDRFDELRKYKMRMEGKLKHSLRPSARIASPSRKRLRYEISTPPCLRRIEAWTDDGVDDESELEWYDTDEEEEEGEVNQRRSGENEDPQEENQEDEDAAAEDPAENEEHAGDPARAEDGEDEDPEEPEEGDSIASS